MENYCVNCKWYSSKYGGYSLCKNPKQGMDLIIGEVDSNFASRVRNSWCGPEGKWFEEKITLFGKIKQYFSIKEGR